VIEDGIAGMDFLDEGLQLLRVPADRRIVSGRRERASLRV
jgi:hypothetical protein